MLCPSTYLEEGAGGDNGHHLMSSGWTGTQCWVFSVTNPVEVLVKLWSSLPAFLPRNDVTSCRTLITTSAPWASTISSALMKYCCLYALPLLIRVYWQQTLSEADCFDCVKLPYTHSAIQMWANKLQMSSRDKAKLEISWEQATSHYWYGFWWPINIAGWLLPANWVRVGSSQHHAHVWMLIFH